MSITVPTADSADIVIARPARPGPAMVAVAVALVVWPAAMVLSSSEPEASAFVPRLAPAPVTAGSWLVVPLADEATRVIGLGEVVVAVAADGMWPVSVLEDGVWRRLLGMPVGVELAPGIGAGTGDGFVVASVGDDRTVVFGYDQRGRFLGATTVFGVEAGVVFHGEKTVVFDRHRPHGRVLGGENFGAPGVVIDAARAATGVVVLTEDGEVFATEQPGAAWVRIGDGVSALVGSEIVYAVGATAATGLTRVGDELEPIHDAPLGPTVEWGGAPAVYDWSTDTVRILTTDGWSAVRMWGSEGFTAEFVGVVDGAAGPTVVAREEQGLALWTRAR